MANTTGKKFGGRKKGTPNKKTLEVLQRIEELGCDPVLGLSEYASGLVKCQTCIDGEVSLDQYYRYSKASMPDVIAEMTPEQRSKNKAVCPICDGKQKRAPSDDLVVKARAELLQYVAPKRKAVEISGDVALSHEDALKELS